MANISMAAFEPTYLCFWGPVSRGLTRPIGFDGGYCDPLMSAGRGSASQCESLHFIDANCFPTRSHLNVLLVGGIPTPLKNDGVRQWEG
jgi:hypothetical protein